jgi:hypothetical protein
MIHFWISVLPPKPAESLTKRAVSLGHGCWRTAPNAQRDFFAAYTVPERTRHPCGRPYSQMPLVPTIVPTGLLVLINQAPDLEPRYGIES